MAVAGLAAGGLLIDDQFGAPGVVAVGRDLKGVALGAAHGADVASEAGLAAGGRGYRFHLAAPGVFAGGGDLNGIARVAADRAHVVAAAGLAAGGLGVDDQLVAPDVLAGLVGTAVGPGELDILKIDRAVLRTHADVLIVVGDIESQHGLVVGFEHDGTDQSTFGTVVVEVRRRRICGVFAVDLKFSLSAVLSFCFFVPDDRHARDLAAGRGGNDAGIVFGAHLDRTAVRGSIARVNGAGIAFNVSRICITGAGRGEILARQMVRHVCRPGDGLKRQRAADGEDHQKA